MFNLLLLIVSQSSPITYVDPVDVVVAGLVEYRPKLLSSFEIPARLSVDSMFADADTSDSMLSLGIEVLRLANKEFERGKYDAALNYYEEIVEEPSTASTPAMSLLYEYALSMTLLSLNRSDQLSTYNAAMSLSKNYLESTEDDSLSVPHGADLRAFILFNQADATYYASYNRGEIRNVKRREQARQEYQSILKKYPKSFVSDIARVSLAWYDLEAKRFDSALSEFDSIIASTRNKDALVLARYGQGLAQYFKGDFLNAAKCFFDEKNCEEEMKLTLNREQETKKLTYNALADSLVDRSLFWRGKSFEQLNFFGDALLVYEHIADTYPQRRTAGDACQKMIEFYMRAKQVDNAEKRVEVVGGRMKTNRSIYRDAYGFGLASLFDYYLSIGDEKTAEVYAKRLTKELGTTEKNVTTPHPIYNPTVYDIPDLRKKIRKISERNPQSQYLPDPLFLLSYLLMESKNYDEAKDILMKLKSWPVPDAVKDRMPEISVQLGRCYYNLEQYAQAITEFEEWLTCYTTGDDARLDLAPSVHYYLVLSCIGAEKLEKSESRSVELLQKALVNLETIKKDYSDSDFYKRQGVKEDIEKLIGDCKKEIGR
ncbi:tetratricopeptide repeat protein [bacterium]|nr:tetratricopeptide repeat protein [bacterium]